MSSYHSSFKYLNKKSDEDFGWIICHFTPDDGESDSNLSQEQVYSDSYNGSKRKLYGTKWNSVANVKITVIKQDGGNFSLEECRNAYRWLTGNPEASWMDLYVGDEVKYRLLCTIQDVKPQKVDARTVGLNIYCESLSPWAFSPTQVASYSATENGEHIRINNLSDDMYSFVNVKTTYVNLSGSSVTIENTTIGDQTYVGNLNQNETIILDNNMFITSDNPAKTFGDSFNFVWPRLKAGENEIILYGDGDITFEYYYPIKMGDCAITINEVRDPICDDSGNIIIDMLSWNRISDKPVTISGYGIQDAYTKTEINSILSNFTQKDVYTKAEIDELLNQIANRNHGIYVQPDEPTDAKNGSIWIDTDDNYIENTSGIYVQPNEPTDAQVGTLWVDTDDNT